LCDWLETCEYSCKKGNEEPMELETDIEKVDYTTYDEYTASYKIRQIKREIIDSIVEEGQVAIPMDQFERKFQTIPRPLLLSILHEIVDKKEFHVITEAGPGKVLLKNQLIIFQPDRYKDLSIPIALRMLPISVSRDTYTPEVYEETKVKEVVEASNDLWDSILEWAATIEGGSYTGNRIPETVLYSMNELGGTTTRKKEREERVGMIGWIYEGLKEDSSLRREFSQVVLQFFWDELLPMSLKESILVGNNGSSIVRSVAKDSYWFFEGSTYLRLLNTDIGGTEYYTIGPTGLAEKSVLSVKEVLERERMRDPLLAVKRIDEQTTGYRYGFLVFRGANDMVFKLTNPPPVGSTKLGKGSVCASSSAVSFELKQLEQMGTILRSVGTLDVGLNEATLLRRRIQNSNRVCTVSNLMLRLMDRIHVQGKRWFYRGLEANRLGHK
jgi:hypothetical protein